ncbi:MAG: hypothetical protein UCH28_07610 [Adlercreutzia sp.]|nr:hypothetical protein [Adlercreutzia sp.]
MIPEFLEYISHLFPSISPYTEEGARLALKQFEQSGAMGSLTLAQNTEDMRQGDIFSEMSVPLVDEAGAIKIYRARVMLLSNTCDCERNSNLEFAVIWPMDELSTDPAKVAGFKSNKNYQFLYLPDARLENDLIDFGAIFSLPRKLFNKMVEAESIQKVASLSWVGYYLFLCKLTVFFMRPEDVEVNKSRDAA